MSIFDQAKNIFPYVKSYCQFKDYTSSTHSWKSGNKCNFSNKKLHKLPTKSERKLEKWGWNYTKISKESPDFVSVHSKWRVTVPNSPSFWRNCQLVIKLKYSLVKSVPLFGAVLVFFFSSHNFSQQRLAAPITVKYVLNGLPCFVSDIFMLL